MKLYRNTLLWLSLVTLLLPSCKKADQYAQLANAQPYLMNNYQTSYLVGDTATFTGRFFLGQPGSRIQIGNAIPAILSDARTYAGDINQYTHQPDSEDVIRFVITAGMGIGNTIPVSVTANGTTITGPALSIQKFAGIQPKTDTTLVVDSLAGLLPTDASFYQSNNLPLVQNMNVSGNGVLCFNNLTGVYKVNNGQVAQLLHVGSILQENGTPFTIQLFLGAAITFGGDSIYFSAQVIENIPDTATAYIFRICKLDIAAGTVTTINRTEVQKGISAANEQGGPFHGPVNSLNIVAADLKTDANGSLYFVNYYSPARTDHDNTVNWYYRDGINTGIASYVMDTYAYQNVCSMGAGGQVNSLFSQSGPLTLNGYSNTYTIPGYPCAQTSDYLVSQDGTKALVCNQQGGVVGFNFNGFAYYDLQQGIPLAFLGAADNASTLYRFSSYDTSSVTGYANAGEQFGLFPNQYRPFLLFDPYSAYTLTSNLLQNNGYILYENYNFPVASIAAINIQYKTAYCYAGTEAGLFATTPAVQNHSTGQAKYVVFPALTMFAGTDKLNGIYYYSGYMDYVNGLHFYKLSSKS